MRLLARTPERADAALRAAFRLPAKEGMARLEKQAKWLERGYPSAAVSLLEWLGEMFSVNRLQPSNFACCLISITFIESPHNGVRLRTLRVCRQRDGKMVLRWVAAVLLMTETNYRQVIGCRDLWMLEAALGRNKGVSKRNVA